MNYDLTNPSMFSFKPKHVIPHDAEVVFVSDLFVSDHVGGAELTSQALIDASPFKVYCVHSKAVTMDLLEQGHEKFWIFGNFANMDLKLIPTIVANMSYSVIEYDYKFCRYRSLDKHKIVEQNACACETEPRGKMISAFLQGARSLWWMSEKQKELYEQRFPSLAQKPSTVLSSVFDDPTFASIKLLREKNKDSDRSGWIVLGSPSWVKGTDQAKKWCEDENLSYEVVWNIPYDQMLTKLASAEGLVYLPMGDDTCPRLVIEAKLLECELVLNDHVQHAREEWFDTDDLMLTESYLYMARSRFWNGIKSDMGERDASISGYTTTYNCIESGYPYVESIMSLLGFCDEVVVADAGSNDGTWEMLEQLANTHENLVIHRCERDRSRKRWAIDFDGRMKALARSLCTKAFCWQQDVDEVVHEADYEKIRQLVKQFPKKITLLCLPVIEYWGSSGKVRCDIHNWKWRVSRNLPGITHGIPRELRRFDEDGELYATRGTDTCDPIFLHDYSRVPAANFYTQDVDTARVRGIHEGQDSSALQQYQAWYEQVVQTLPSVHHYSWYNLERKIRSYRSYWARFWESMYNERQEDTAENNMFFDKPWSDVTDDDIEQLAERLEVDMGGWVFHRKVDFNVHVPHITCAVSHPTIMDEWIEDNTMHVEECDE